MMGATAVGSHRVITELQPDEVMDDTEGDDMGWAVASALTKGMKMMNDELILMLLIGLVIGGVILATGGCCCMCFIIRMNNKNLARTESTVSLTKEKEDDRMPEDTI